MAKKKIEAAEAEEAVIPSNAQITEIATLVELQLKAEKEFDAAEAELEKKKKVLVKVREVDLPLAMKVAGVKSITLPNSMKVEIKEDIYASIPKNENYEDALEWLRLHELGDIIKNDLTISFGKGEDEEADVFYAALVEQGYTQIEQNVGVHPQTLKAAIKECMAKGLDVPDTLFAYGDIVKAKITAPKGK